MKRALLLALPYLLIASVGLAREEILSFDSVITVNRDRTLVVQETLTVVCERDQIRHGIRRDFPVDYKSRLNVFTHIPFDVVSVRVDDQPEDFHLGGRAR